MNQEFKNKQARVVNNFDYYAVALQGMVSDNSAIGALVAKVKDISKAIAKTESVFDKVSTLDSSYSLEVLFLQDEKMKWMIGLLDADKQNGNLIEIIDNTLSLMMSVMMCEIRTLGLDKAQAIMKGINCKG